MCCGDAEDGEDRDFGVGGRRGGLGVEPGVLEVEVALTRCITSSLITPSRRSATIAWRSASSSSWRTAGTRRALLDRPPSLGVEPRGEAAARGSGRAPRSRSAVSSRTLLGHQLVQPGERRRAAWIRAFDSSRSATSSASTPSRRISRQRQALDDERERGSRRRSGRRSGRARERAPASVVSGTASAAASETAPRMPTRDQQRDCTADRGRVRAAGGKASAAGRCRERSRRTASGSPSRDRRAARRRAASPRGARRPSRCAAAAARRARTAAR